MTIREEILEIPVPDYESEIQKPMAGKNHSIIQRRLIVALDKYDDQYDVMPELDLELPARARPDICIYPNLSYDWWDEVHKVKEPPITTIEILSYAQGVEDLLKKARDIYFSSGVKSSWFVEPAFGIVHVAVPGQETLTFTKKDRLKDPATGIEVELSEIFR